MAFRCEYCNIPQPPGSKPIRLTLLRRKKLYSDGRQDSYGSEIVKEGNFDEQCAKLVGTTVEMIKENIDHLPASYHPVQLVVEPDYPAYS